MVENPRTRIGGLYNARIEAASKVYDRRALQLSDAEASEYERRRLELSGEIAKMALSIPAVYTQVPAPHFSFSLSGKPPFSSSFEFELRRNDVRNPTIDISTDTLYAVKDNGERAFLEITKDGLPLWHLPNGFQLKMYGGVGGIAGFSPFSEKGRSSYLFSHTSKGVSLSEKGHGKFFWVDNNGKLGAYWTPQVTEEPSFLQSDPVYNPSPGNHFMPRDWYEYVTDENRSLGTKKLPSLGRVHLYSF